MDHVGGTVEDMKGSLTGDSSQEISGGYIGFLYLLAAADGLDLYVQGRFAKRRARCSRMQTGYDSLSDPLVMLYLNRPSGNLQMAFRWLSSHEKPKSQKP